MLEDHVKDQRFSRYPTGPTFLNPLVNGAIVESATDSLIDPEHSLIARIISLFSILKFPVNFTGILESRLSKPMLRRGLSG